MGGESDSVVSNEDNSRKGGSPKSFPCRFCFRIFSRVRGLNRHMSTHLQEMRNEARALLEQNYWKMNNQHVAPQNYASIPGGLQTQVQTWGQTGCPSSLSTYSNQNVGGGISGVGPSLPTSYLNQQQKDHINYQMRETYPSHSNILHCQRNDNLQIGGTERILKMMNNQHGAPQNYASIPGGVQTQVQTWPQAGCPSSFSTCSYQNEGGGISGVGSSLPTSYLNQQQQDHTNYQQQQQQQEFAQNPGDLLYYQTILGGVQTHVELSSPSQVQAWPQAGCSSSLSTYSNHNVGGGISGAGASLPTSYLNQQQQDHINYQMRENVSGGISGVGPSLPTSYLNQQQQDHINYQMRERYPSHPHHQMRETYPSLPYQRNNNLQIVGGASLVNNSGISGPSLPMNNHLQIRGTSFPTLQEGNPNLVVSGYAAPSASEQHQQFFSVDPSQQEYAQNPGDLTDYQMRERYLFHPNHQMREIYPCLPYQANNNLQIGGGASLVNNSGIGGPSLAMNSHLQIRGPSFPALQEGNPNLVVGGYAAASASEQHQQFFSSSAETQDSEDVISE